MIETQQFAGATKTNTSFLTPLERRLAPFVLPRIPRWLETHHLTLLTLLWSGCIVLFSWFARENRRWLWLVSLMIFLQYVTDHYDGKVGKFRNTGLVRWGYYMDHLLDYCFLCAILFGYLLILPPKAHTQIFLTLAIFAGYDMSTFLAFSATDRLKISYLKFGPTEFRLAMIVINAFLAEIGIRYMASGLKYVNLGGIVGLVLVAYKTQKTIWQMDMEKKRLNQPD